MKPILFLLLVCSGLMATSQPKEFQYNRLKVTSKLTVGDSLVVTSTGNSGDVLTRQANGLVKWQAPTGGSGSAGVSTITGTTNQIIASGSTGNVSLSLPQNIHTGASPFFAGLQLGGASSNVLYAFGTASPVGEVERTPSSTTSSSTVFRITSSHSNYIGNFFGPRLGFDYSGANLPKTEVASIAAVRNGADNTAQMSMTVMDAGTNKVIATMDGTAGVTAPYGLKVTGGTVQIAGNGAAAGNHLISDASGFGTWKPLGNVVTGTNGTDKYLEVLVSGTTYYLPLFTVKP